MTRLAILADIHGNVPALEAVLADVAAQDVDEVLVGGDLVGRGPQGSAVVKRVRELGFESIGGNHEDYLLDFRRGEIPSDWRTTEEWAAARWMAAELDADDVAYIEALPFSLLRPGLRLVHGTPKSNREGIGPWTGDDDLQKQLGRVEEELLVCAHTHRPLVRELDSGMVVNVGSVGLPFNGDQRAQYAIFERRDGAWHVEPRQVTYDLEDTFRIYETSGFLDAGGVTARLLRLELEHASPLLVPFLEWAKITGVEASMRRLDNFFADFRPGQSIRQFFRELQKQHIASDLHQ